LVFEIRTLLQSHIRVNQKEFIKLTSDKVCIVSISRVQAAYPRTGQEIDEWVDQRKAEPLGSELSATEQSDIDAAPVNAWPNGPKPKLASRLEDRDQPHQSQP
jgi:hypothetical protein